MSQTGNSCCGVVEEVRSRRSESKPQPWIVRKFAVGFTVLIVGYATYVYAGRFCRDMIVKSSSALGSQATGGVWFVFLTYVDVKPLPCLVVFLVVFCLLLLLMSWCYFVVRFFFRSGIQQHANLL